MILKDHSKINLSSAIFITNKPAKKALPDITNVYRVMLIDFLLSCMKSGVSLFHDQFLTNINDIIGQAIP